MILHFILCLFAFHLTKSVQGSTSKDMINNDIAKPGCQTHCGNIQVPYPFGIGKDTNCYIDGGHSMTCNTTHKPSKLFLASSNIEIYNISDSELRIFPLVSFRCYDQLGGIGKRTSWWTFIASVGSFSEKNKLTVIGCDDYALITAERVNDNFTSGCFGLCSNPLDVPDGQCSGKGCCQTSIANGFNNYKIQLNSFENHKNVWSSNKCGYAFLSEEDSFQFGGTHDLSNSSDILERVQSTLPVVIDWVIGLGRNCTLATECKDNSHCYDVDGGGYSCICNKGYQGNPYLDQGCSQDIDECQDPTSCYGVCTNTIGSYSCTCAPGYEGNPFIRLGCQDIDECKDLGNKTCYGCNNTPGSYACTCPLGTTGNATTPNGCKGSISKANLVTAVLGTSLLAMLLGITGIYFCLRRRRLTTLREKFFEQNGGVLLKQKMSSQGSHEAMTLFSTGQLQKATNNYSQDQIVGRGAYGVVYKGVLPDKRVVAIKKSKLVDQSQAEQFINEVVILTQVIHRNVVKLLGCCLEEEVPVLVYEFISNNTLFHHIHHKSGGMSWLSWENRLRVASEAAGALSYLHSETTMPIIHRDVKSSNILLDNKYTTKIADFGASRLVPLDHNQVSTLIMGTLGYLDPEYFHTSQLTDKSDVYSFGVVLAELITGKKPIGVDRSNEEKSLATFFVKSMKENRLFEIVEPRLLREGTLEKLQAVGELVKRCLNMHGCDRPTMKEVAMELECLRKLTTHPWVHPNTSEEDTRSLILEVELPDLYDAPLVSFNTNEWETFPSTTTMEYKENKPR